MTFSHLCKVKLYFNLLLLIFIWINFKFKLDKKSGREVLRLTC